MASNTGCTSPGELAMTFNISAVAACCSRASFNSLPRFERFNGAAVVALRRRLVLVGLRPLIERALRVFVALALPPVFDGRVMSAPRSTRPSYRAKPSRWKGPTEPESWLATAQVGVGFGHDCRQSPCPLNPRKPSSESRIVTSDVSHEGH